VAYPVLAQSVAASVLTTLAYTAWSGRRKIEVCAQLLLDQACIARIESQDGQTVAFIQQRYVEVCTDALLLVYCVELTKQRFDEQTRGAASSGDGAGSGSEGDEAMVAAREFIASCEEMSLAGGSEMRESQSQSGGGGQLLVPALRDNVRRLMVSRGLLLLHHHHWDDQPPPPPSLVDNGSDNDSNSGGDGGDNDEDSGGGGGMRSRRSRGRRSGRVGTSVIELDQIEEALLCSHA
jgi:hypothetical protein